jgi:hypothetical protein
MGVYQPVEAPTVALIFASRNQVIDVLFLLDNWRQQPQRCHRCVCQRSLVLANVGAVSHEHG